MAACDEGDATNDPGTQSATSGKEESSSSDGTGSSDGMGSDLVSWEIDDWDENDDEILTENEIVAGFEDATVDWDADGEAAISEAELTSGLFASWDTDGDGQLESSEFEEGAELWFGDKWDYAGFEDLDSDGDKELTLEEYGTGMEEVKVYDDLDENDDDNLTPAEIAAGYETYWDADGDGSLEAVEWADRSPVTYEPLWSLSVWDTDDDEILTENELATGLEDLTVDWNDDGEPALSRVEMAGGLFDLWDTDGDGNLEKSEFEENAELWFGGKWDYAGFEDLDSDGDKELTLEEYDAGLDDMKVYDDLDENDDEKVTAGELADGYESHWDADGDGRVESVEWEGLS